MNFDFFGTRPPIFGTVEVAGKYNGSDVRPAVSFQNLNRSTTDSLNEELSRVDCEEKKRKEDIK